MPSLSFCSQPRLTPSFKKAQGCGVGSGRGSDPALLWPWRRPAATALLRALAWGPPYVVGVAQEMAEGKKKKKKQSNTKHAKIETIVKTETFPLLIVDY